ncbi:hypothetical protein ACO0LG_08555 [Undibacterium sp. Ji42W]|uniref:hypothetical protein n=1 Tax=Undibacterium sp. Ji42W TaxID=3413039 RepID=UPI003BF38431
MHRATTWVDCAVVYAVGVVCGIGLMVITGYDAPAPPAQSPVINTEVKEVCTVQAAAKWWTDTTDMKAAKRELCGGK